MNSFVLHLQQSDGISTYTEHTVLPWGIVILEKPVVFHFVEKLSVSYATVYLYYRGFCRLSDLDEYNLHPRTLSIISRLMLRSLHILLSCFTVNSMRATCSPISSS